MPTITYDKESEILTLQLSKKKSVDSDVQDNAVVDYDKDGNIVAIDIMNIDMREFRKAEPAYLYLRASTPRSRRTSPSRG